MYSCIMPAYGRAWTISEAIASFLNQDCDEPAELVIINDNPSGRLIAPAVKEENRTIRVYNVQKRLPTLSHKVDLLVNECKYGTIFPWDDDDISLPWRLRYCGEKMRETGAAYLSPQAHVFDDYDELKLSPRGIYPADCFTKAAYLAVGGSVGDGHNDQNLVSRIKAAGLFQAWHRATPSFLYRWASIEAHHSHHVKLADAMAEYHRKVTSDPRYRTGDVQLRSDYERATALMAFEAVMIADEYARLHGGELPHKKSNQTREEA